VLFIERGYQVVRSYHPGRGIRGIFPLARAMAFVNGEPLAESMAIDAYHPAFPTGLAQDAAGRWYLADAAHRRVWQVDDEAGTLRCVVASQGAGRGGPAALGFGPDGVLWVLDYSEPGIRGYRPRESGRWEPVAACCHGLGTERLHCGGEEGAGLVCLSA
jgi:streptogramin lyase